MSKPFLLFVLLLTVTICQQSEACECQNGGSCLMNQTYQVCTCTNNFIGKHCSTSSQQINQTKQTFSITSNYSYFFTELNYSTIYLIQMFFCPVQFQYGTKYELYIEFEKEDSSIFQDLNIKKVQMFSAAPNQCLLFRSPISSPYMKIDGTSPKLVARIRTVEQNLPLPGTKEKEGLQILNKRGNNSMTITAYRYPLYNFDNLNLGDYLVIFTVTILFLTSLAFFILNRSIRRRMTLYQFQAARPRNSISHFDAMMPSVYYPKDTSEASESDEKQCMICLLGVLGSQTRTTPCGHIYHKECIDEWGHKNLICPACRGSLKDPTQIQMIDIYRA